MKNIFTIFLLILLIINSVYIPTFAAESVTVSDTTKLLRTAFSSDLAETAVKENDGYLGIPVTFSVFKRESAPDANFCLLYVIGHCEERIGTDSDEDIINDFLDQGYIVTVIDYAFNKKAVGYELGYSIKEILADMRNGKYVGNYAFYNENIYVIPSGCRLERDIYYFSIDTMAPYGVNEYILHTYNTYYAGIKKDNNGNLLPKATKLEECLNKDGKPIYLDLDMDIIYPANPKEEVPVFALASSSENRCAVVNRYNAQTVYFATALLGGYAGVVYNHEFMPMCRADHYNYDERFFTLSDYTANRSHSAAIRRIKYLADTYGYSSEYIANFGFSKSGLGPAIIADKTHEQRGEIKTLDEYCPEGKDVTQSPGEQPWLYYEGTNTPIDSNVTVVYAGAGRGVCNYVETCVNENVVPFAASIGTVDTIGGFNTYLPKTNSIFNSVNAETLFIEAENIDHNPAHLYNDTYQVDYLDAVWTFLDNHIKAASKKEAPKVLWSTPRSDILYETLSENEISIRFSRAMNVQSVIENTRVVRLSDGKEVEGTWSTLHGDTSFYFNSDYIINASSYRLEINEKALAKDGIALSIPYAKTFTLNGSSLLSAQDDTYLSKDGVSHANETVLSTANGNTAYVSFTRENGFADVTKAKLLLNRTASNNAILELSTLENGFDENTLTPANAPAVKNRVGSLPITNDIAAIDVTEYLSDANGNTLSFSLKADSKTGNVYSKDFNGANSSNFANFNHYRWGNGDAVMNFSDDSYNGTDCIYITGRSWQTRLKFLNSLGKRTLTNADIGTIYKTSFWIKSEESTSLLVGLFAESGTAGYVGYGEQNFNMTANEWTHIEYVTVITKEMVDVNACAVTLVPHGSKPFYLDDITVAYDNAPCEFLSGEAQSGLSCSLLLYTPEEQEIALENYAVISNGEYANDVINEQPNINGRPVSDISEAKKGYIKIPISEFDLSGSVTLGFSISALANNSLSVYGIADDDSRFAETFDGNINWNNAYANDLSSYSVIKEKVYGKKPLATLDTSVSTQFSIDVKDYVTYMADLGYKAVTFIFCADQQSTVTEVTFEGIDSYDNFVASYEMKGFDTGITTDPTNSANSVFYFDKSGKENPSGYAQNIAFTGLIKSGDLFDESDIGYTYNISFKQYIVLDGYTTYSIYGNIGKPGSTNYTLPSYLNCKTLVNGNVATPPANDWFTVEYTLTVTEETVRDYSNWTSIIVGSGWRATRIYVDDITVTKKADNIKIPIDSNKVEISNTDFENIEAFENYTPVSFPANCEIALKQDPKNENNTAFYFEKTGVEATGYYQAVYIKNLIAKNGTFTNDDLGCVYTVRYKEYVVFTADDRKEYTVYDSISDSGFRSFTAMPSYLTRKFYYNGQEITGQIPTNDWFEVEMSFTVTADMIGTTSAPLGIMLASGWRASGIYVDDITVSSSLTASENAIPSLTFKGNKKSAYSNAAVISGKTPDKAEELEYSIDITNGVLKNPSGLKKLYTIFAKQKLLHTQEAKLNIEVSENSIGNTIYVYGLYENVSTEGLTWNNAYANSEGLGMSNSLVYSNSHLAAITLTETSISIDVTEFMKSTVTNEQVTFVFCSQNGEGITEFTNFSLNVKGFPLYASVEKADLILPEGNVTADNAFIAAQTFNGLDVKVEDVTFFVDEKPIDKMYTKRGEVYYIYPNNLSSGNHTAYAVFTYSDGTVAVTDTKNYTIADNTVFGDVNGDGNVNAADLALLKKVLAELTPLDSEEVKYPDVDGNGGTPNAADLAKLKKIVAELE